ncbi:hypothetical protein [Streptomyces tsukubensis]|uniref:Uncharacterized protein n=1 Tax=Streptomyces tsukubensis TaxID=83656 RepID=A0A1V4A0P7_9ACTN|nr:hypothetical protein [Streptomyces tsukubensis]OON72418.1 hypothetical protein B1H18_29730 [Streptomyces tsukubensis]QFR96946.1 hypothetical protein GBW32_32755 [Streptomyces tsukubensis]
MRDGSGGGEGSESRAFAPSVLLREWSGEGEDADSGSGAQADEPAPVNALGEHTSVEHDGVCRVGATTTARFPLPGGEQEAQVGHRVQHTGGG